MFGALDISTSALVAQRIRATAISANIAGQGVNFDENGENNPFQRRIVVFEPGDPAHGSSNGVHVREIMLDTEYQLEESDDPRAVNGYLKTPNINPMMEQVNMLEASRAYEANIAAAEATKSMIQTSLRLLA